MVSASFPALVWARDLEPVVDGEADQFAIGYIFGFLNGDCADLVTRMYVENVMQARLRGISA